MILASRGHFNLAATQKCKPLLFKMILFIILLKDFFMISPINDNLGYFFDPLGLSGTRNWENTAAKVVVTFASFLVGIATLGLLHGAYAYYATNSSSHSSTSGSIHSGNTKLVSTIPDLGVSPHELTSEEREDKIPALETYIQSVESGKSNHTLKDSIDDLKAELKYLKSYHTVSKLIKTPSKDNMISREQITSKREQIKALIRPRGMLLNSSFKENETEHCCRLNIDNPGPIIGVDKHGVYLCLRRGGARCDNFSSEISVFFGKYVAEESDKIHFFSLKGLLEFVSEIPVIKRSEIVMQSIVDFCIQNDREFA